MKKITAFMFAALLALSITVNAYAQSDVTDIVDTYEGIPVTVNGVYITPEGTTASNTQAVIINAAYGGTGKFIMPSLLTGEKWDRFYVRINSDYLPSPGTYYMVMRVMQSEVDWGANWSASTISVNSKQTNTTSYQNTSADAEYWILNGAYCIGGTVEIGSNTNSIDFVYHLSNSIGGMFDGYVWSYSITPSNDTPLVSSPDVVNGTSGTDNAIMENTSQLVDAQNTTNQKLEEIVQTISSQLTSLWNQFAGEFTNMYSLWNQQHSEQLTADRENTEDIIEELGDNTTTIVNNNNDNTDRLIENNNQNTDTIVNGYDSSALDDSSNALNDSLTDYDDVQSGITESLGGYFDNFDYEDIAGYPSGVLSSLLYFGNYLQYIFESLSTFNLPITLGLTLTFVLMLIGYFRYGR